MERGKSVRRIAMKISNAFLDSKYDYIEEFNQKCLEEALNFAFKHKILPLFLAGCNTLNITLPTVAESYKKTYEARWRARLETIKDIVQISQEHGLQVVIFKTLKPFPYDPDDVDVLALDNRSFQILVNELKRRNFFQLFKGTPEVSFRKLFPDTYVDVDIHTELAIGYLKILDKEFVRKAIVYRSIKVDRTCIKVPVLSDVVEVVREAAYVLLKDFSITPASFFLGIHALKNLDYKDLQRTAQRVALAFHLEIYLATVYLLAASMFGWDYVNDIKYVPSMSALLLLNLKKPYDIPYMYHPFHVTVAYLAKIFGEIKNKNVNVVLQVFHQPSAKGVGSILWYVENLLHGW